MNFFEKIQNFLLDKIIRKKIKAQFGGSLKTFVSGGGALDKEVGYFLNAIGLPTFARLWSDRGFASGKLQSNR